MVQFVGFMPSVDNYDPSKHTPAENKARMFEKWKLYLLAAKDEFGSAG